MPRPPDSFAENPVYHIPAGPVHPEKIETDFFAGRPPLHGTGRLPLTPSAVPVHILRVKRPGQAVCRTGVWYVWQAPTEE